jgi:hypothetical protein
VVPVRRRRGGRLAQHRATEDQEPPGAAECSLFILDLANPYRFLEIRGRARIEPDDDYAFADKVRAKYGGVDLRANDRPGESRVVVTIEPVNVWPVNMRG